MEKKFELVMKQDIIQWELKCWSTFKKKMEPFQQRVKLKGFELFLEQYWVNCNERKYKEKNNRIDFYDGYTYCCRYSIKKNGKNFKHKYDPECLAICIFEFVTIRSKLILPSLCYQLHIFQNRPLYVKMVDFDLHFEKEINEDINEYLQKIEEGEFMIE